MACLFAHATGLCGQTFRPILRAVESPSVQAFDFKGHGRRGGELLSEGFSWDQEGVDDVVGAAASFRNDNNEYLPLVGIGHSFGGACMIKAELAHPGLFHRLILCEPILFDYDVDPNNSFHLADRALKRKSSWSSREEAQNYLVSKPMFAGWDLEAFSGYLDDGFVDLTHITNQSMRPAEPIAEQENCFKLSCAPISESLCFRGVGKSVIKELNKIQCPVTLMIGGNSTHLDIPGKRSTYEYFEYLSTLFSHEASRMITIENSGHFFPQEQPQAVADEINRQLHEIVRGHLRQLMRFPQETE